LEIGGRLELNPSLLLFTGSLAAVLIFFAWLLRDPRKTAKRSMDPLAEEELDRRHVTYFPQVLRALAAEDITYLTSRCAGDMSSRVRKERRRIVLAYLAFLRSDFLKLWQMANVIAKMSQKVGAAQEIERFRLILIFYARYELIRFKFQFGFTPVPELGSLSDFVSSLALRLDIAMRELGERAALTSSQA
jgi:hypothetical protein